MKNNVHQNYTRWSIRRLSVGVASVVVASGFFILTSPVQSVLANEVAATPVSQTKAEKSQKDKQEDVNQLINKAVDTALAAPKETTSQSSNNKPAVENKGDAANTPKEVSENRAATPAETTPVTSPQQVKDSVANNIKPNTEVPASYLEKANVPGPFLAGVNQVIPYEAFGGDGMLTRLLLKSSENAPWSDNGTAKNPALLPLEGLTKGQYFYEVDLNGNTTGKEGQALLDQLRANGTQTYQATVKVYGNKDGKADLSNVVATKNISVTLNGLTPAQKVNESVTNNIKAQTEVPASYLEKANVPGPFLAGVNQVIPYEAFGGDGMLTRLLLKSSENAPWSDNGTAKNPALLPLEGLTKGQYFYEVDLNGNTTGKEGQALLDQLRANGTQTYQATVKVYGNKDGKADLSNVIATREVRITLHKESMATNQSSSTTNTTSTMKEEHAAKDEMKPTTMEHSQQMNSKTMEQETAKKEELSTPMMKQQKEEAKEMKKNDSMKKENKATLPVTGETTTNTSALGAFSAGLAFVLGILGLKAKKERI
ncbi:SSURE domain-containing protein [Granulicatella elegans]|uniref:YSIRK family Gram-positive signal peptide n=1 Tax=Granulicatella elegans ATCC 700633 TaxID=626369 RepID=T5LGX1_9LACT|nr:fibronectin-binding SSURE repeat-containing protein [Granulicatella elegans]EQM96941.1 YSIRK family Gram-positive signal peptide [Granulicatella elegans ATCC 700633]